MQKIFLLFLLGMAPQTITQMNVPVPKDHPGQAAYMVTERDLWLLKIGSWAAGFDVAQKANCMGQPGNTEKSCSYLGTVEVEAGTDSESILLHANYPADAVTNTGRADCGFIKLIFSSRAPKWLRFECRVNGGPIEVLK